VEITRSTTTRCTETDKTNMDQLSEELHEYLLRLGDNPHSVSEKMEHFTKHLLHLLSVSDEDTIKMRYGLFGTEKLSVEDIARIYGNSAADTQQKIEVSLRKIAVTPEWQTIKQLI
jgi:DNA-directed RNA polymerase sigma subunit (sigma70/sigma32)